MKKFIILFLAFLIASGCVGLSNKNPDISLAVNQPAETRNKEKPSINKTVESGENPSVSSIPEKGKPAEGNTVPSINPKPPLLSLREAVKQVKEFYIGDLKTVTRGGKPILILYDISGDGQPEVFSLAVEVKEKKQADVAFLADYSRLFSENKMPIHFYLLIYGNNSGKMYIMNRLDLGEKYVYRSFKRIVLDRGNPMLTIISVGFQTEEGLERKWLIFKGPDVKLLSTFRLKENLSVKTETIDIDNNGTIDILVEETGAEEGSGYETFLTWYKWNGTRFSEYRNTNIVRNLKAFLLNIKNLLEHGKTDELLNFAVDRKYILKYKNKGADKYTILFNALGFSAFFDTMTTKPESVLKNIRDVTFPEILENPFSSKDREGWYFTPSYRVTITNGLSFIAETEIRMFRNPFGKRQFSLVPVR
ncbi:MAG: hypothetical protein GXP33_16655 [Spirochaetes bacterium]|nr:hypothetical protein [Spirochaetota bacterium]